mmetsp:Transcript_23360/g.31289  ORF Transcript_23360/g.31289 Transcript_23360/m.31289 type:complete len:92 (-) Transcript_23360:1254-1529(-)
MLFQMRDKLARTDLPNAHLALHATRADELAALGKADRGHAALVCIFDLPELLAVVNPVGSDSAVTPAADNDLIGEDSAEGGDSTLTGSCLG